MLRFKRTRIWPLNPKAMDEKMALLLYRHCRIKPRGKKVRVRGW